MYVAPGFDAHLLPSRCAWRRRYRFTLLLGARWRHHESARSASHRASRQEHCRNAQTPKLVHTDLQAGFEIGGDDGCCTFVSEDGRRCAARRFLEIDHVKPWAEGGLETVENLRLRCRAHNLRAATQHFGDDHIRDALARARGKISVPAGDQL